eukprot:12692504-Alexandrium_andersonii.AAC.1
MSASLVGSEMCIRDRPTAAPASLGPLGAAGVYRRAPGGPAEQAAPAEPCLLYTSDAADDM